MITSPRDNAVRLGVTLIGLALTAITLGGCSDTATEPAPSTSSAASTSAAAPAPSPTSASAPASTATATAQPSGATTVSLTDDIVAQIRIAIAHNNVELDHYAPGLRPDATYLAETPDGSLWAGATLLGNDPDAVVSLQNQGSYYLLQRDPQGSWHVHPVGISGQDDMNRCGTVGLPESVRLLWAWPDDVCPPPLNA